MGSWGHFGSRLKRASETTPSDSLRYGQGSCGPERWDELAMQFPMATKARHFMSILHGDCELPAAAVHVCSGNSIGLVLLTQPSYSSVSVQTGWGSRRLAQMQLSCCTRRKELGELSWPGCSLGAM